MNNTLKKIISGYLKSFFVYFLLFSCAYLVSYYASDIKGDYFLYSLIRQLYSNIVLAIMITSLVFSVCYGLYAVVDIFFLGGFEGDVHSENLLIFAELLLAAVTWRYVILYSLSFLINLADFVFNMFWV